MPKLNKTESGLLLYEDFKQSSLIWTPSPNNYQDIEFGEDGLRIRHSDLYKTITLEEPEGNFSFMCKINHKPIDADDIGGVIIMSNDTFYAECQSYVATKPSYITNANQTEDQIIDFINQFLENTLNIQSKMMMVYILLFLHLTQEVQVLLMEVIHQVL